MKKLFLTLILIVTTLIIHAQSIRLVDRIKAEHIYNFGIYVNWKDKTLFDGKDKKFIIGVYSADTSMHYLLKKICKYRILKWRKIQLVYFSDSASITFSHILYIGSDKRNEVGSIDKKISKNPTLLISDSCHNYTNTMINFFPRNALKRVEINKETIEQRGMKTSPLLFTIAKKYEEDWEQMFIQSEEQLAVERELLAEQSEILNKQKEEIIKKQFDIQKLSESISIKEKELENQQLRLNELMNDLNEKNAQVLQKNKVLLSQQRILSNQTKDIEKQTFELSKQKEEFNKQTQVLEIQKSEIQNQETLISNQTGKINKSIQDLKKQQLVVYFLIAIVIMIGLFSITLVRSIRQKKRANNLLKKKNTEIYQQNEEIQSQRDEIEAQRDEISSQRDMVIAQKKQMEEILNEVTDSIRYARHIQRSILPSAQKCNEILGNHFIYYKPKDIVSGDFYWIHKVGELIFVAVADCTGHGVPGAFMSMLGVSALNEVIHSRKIYQPHLILNALREIIISSLQQHTTGADKLPENRDGMDISLCVIDIKSLKLEYAGANNPIYILKENSSEIREIKPDKMPIGTHVKLDSFNLQTIDLNKGDTIYLFSDGFADQFGGPLGKKFKYKQLKDILIRNAENSLLIQKEKLHETFNAWKENLEQVDDITILGIKI